MPLIKYELVFDEKIDGPFLKQHVLSKYGEHDILIVEEDEELDQDEEEPVD